MNERTIMRELSSIVLQISKNEAVESIIEFAQNHRVYASLISQAFKPLIINVNFFLTWVGSFGTAWWEGYLFRVFIIIYQTMS